MRLQPLTLDEVCTSLGILDDVGIVKMEGKRDMMKRMVSRRAHAWRAVQGGERDALRCGFDAVYFESALAAAAALNHRAGSFPRRQRRREVGAG